jgi:prophage antirepressor-like protein
MTSLKIFNNDVLNVNIKTVTDDDNNIWFKGKDIATFLEYQDTKQALRVNVDEEYKMNYESLVNASRGVSCTPLTFNEKNTIHIKEAGLYQLVFQLKKPEAKQFTKWIIEDVIPSIRKIGKYSIALVENQISLMNERDLHFKVIDFIRTYYPHCLLYAGLGEIQDTSNKRIYAYRAGYISGTSDIIINNLHKQYNGLTIELKTPTGKGKLSDKQHSFLDMSKLNGHKILVSNDYDEIIKVIIEYMIDTRLLCVYCNRRFKNIHTLRNHHKVIRKITAI